MKLACLALLWGSVVLMNSETSASQFNRATYFPTGQQPSEVVTGDFNNDGNIDLAFADWLSNQVAVLLGNGDGTFQKPLTFSVPGPTDLAAGDLNEDGNLDLVVTETGGSAPGKLAVYLGDGHGKFHLKTRYALGDHTGVVTLADFNGDGHLDVAAGDEGKGSSGVVRIFLGNGEGTLGKPAAYQIGQWLGIIAAGDLNGDHSPDLAVSEPMNGSVAVLLNDGTGKFGKPVIYQAGGGGGEVTDVKIADLRHNGKQDLVAANGSYGMVVLLNKGDGTFEKERYYLPCKKTCLTTEAVTVADFNLDGILDVATAAHIGDGSLYYGKGDGTFKSAVPIHNSVGNFQDSGPSIATGDFNHDGAPDLAIPIQNDGKVAIMLNTQ